MRTALVAVPYLERLRDRVRRRQRDHRCLLCGGPCGGDRFNICSTCRPPDSPAAVDLARAMDLFRKCPTCGLDVPNMDLHLYVAGGSGGHPPPAGPAPNSARWILEVLFGGEVVT
jgi:hypothetical protein